MSVINQMLKDLDKRQNEQRLSSEHPAPVMVNSPAKISLVTVITIILVINILAVVIWQLYAENQALKADKHSTLPADTTLPAALTATNQANAPVNFQQIPAVTVDEKPKVVAKQPDTGVVKQLAEAKQLTDAKQIAEANTALATAPVQTPNVKKSTAKTTTVNKTSGTQSTQVKPQAQTVLPAKVDTHNTQLQTLDDAPKLTISRKKLSSDELVAQKLAQAEQALNSDQLTRAEQLFEDILLVAPGNKTARRQLAALWFGRKSYQPALNLLSQGIALAPDDSEYRIMKARIYLSQGQRLAAIDTLKGLAALENVEYQALLANNAQQAAQYQVAINAYQILTKMQPDIGRWWLGLAVAYDSNSQFKQAQMAYKNVISKADLSDSAQQFARQRLQELGE